MPSQIKQRVGLGGGGGGGGGAPDGELWQTELSRDQDAGPPLSVSV